MRDDHMTPFVFRTEQFVPKPLDEVFEFFSKAENLQQVTPPWLHFQILSVDPPNLREGTLIRYSIRWSCLPIRWITTIADWEPPHRFVDVQLSGPYQLWRHEHRFVACGNGTWISDEVRYLLPFGIVGRIAHRLKVRSDIESIFTYRRAAVIHLLDSKMNWQTSLCPNAQHGVRTSSYGI